MLIPVGVSCPLAAAAAAQARLGRLIERLWTQAWWAYQPTEAWRNRKSLASSWRRGSESNRRRRLCRPLHDHSATPPDYKKSKLKRESAQRAFPLFMLERETSLELATSTLARLRSTN